jgi:hypothetical protein
MKRNNNFQPVFFYFWASIALMLAVIFSMLGVQPVLARGSSQGTATTWYVITSGNDANDCQTSATACATIQGALGKAASGDTIKVATGTYTASSGTEVVLISKNITFSGGWDETFSAQDGKSSIDGQKARRGITVNNTAIASVDHFKIRNGYNSTQGGGLQNSGRLSLSDSDISGNVSDRMGGGIYNSGLLTIDNSSISQNSAGTNGYYGDGGGGIYVTGTLTLNNSTISGNTGNFGEGVLLYNGTFNSNNSTISGNKSYGFRNENGKITLQNTIVAGNGGSSDCYNNTYGYSGTVLSLGYNLIGNSYSCSFSPVTGDQVGTNAKPINARLGMLQDNGGATQTQALYSDSPALNAGNPATPGSGGAACLATDQRGIARPVGSACDIGAYEGSVPGVKSITRVNPNPTNASNLDFIVTFTEAVTGVDATDFALITTWPVGTSITAVTGSDTTYTVSVNISGPGAGSLRLDVLDDDSIVDTLGTPLSGHGSGNGNFTAGEVYTIPTLWYVSTSGSDANNCFTITTPCASINGAIAKAATNDSIKVALGTYTASSGTEVVLINKNLTLSGGWDEAFSAQNGKSIIDAQKARRGMTVSSPMIATVTHFEIQNGFSSYGGGIFNSGNLILNDSIISGNVSESYGGGLYNCSTLTVNNTTISGNVSKANGGGVYNNSTLTVNNTTISGNSAGDALHSGMGGGGIYNNSVATLNNSTVSNNTLIGKYNFGSGIYAGNDFKISNSTISNNTGGNGEGIYIRGVPVIITNSTISGNQTYGLYNDGGNASLQNTIIAGNGASSDCYRMSGYSIKSLGYNLIGRSDGCSFTASTGDLIGTIAQPIDARLGALRDHGGATFTQALLSDSPAIDAGNPAAPDSGPGACLATDQRGVARPIGRACDIGAYEGSVSFVKSITRASANPTSALSVDFVVTFSEPVTGVDMTAPFNDFALTTAGLSNASITSVSGSGAIYTVSVDASSVNGSLRLDVVDDDSILDTTGNSIGGPGAGNGSFTAGETYTILNPSVSSITRASLNPAAALSVKFIVTFSEPVTGVDMAAPFKDFAITTTGAASAAITSVTGSGATYTVTVTTGLGADFIRLDVIDDDSILGANDRPLGGTGAGNGNFKTGEVYKIKSPVVSSITFASPNPVTPVTSAIVKFAVIFSEPVSGVDKVAPFKDFALTQTALKSAAITAVSGSGAAYIVSVTVNAGAGNGSLRLNVIDDDSIHSLASGRPLAGAGIGDGNFTTGKTYSILVSPNPLAPSGDITQVTPTYVWSKIPGATQYYYQVWKGTIAVYTQRVGASVCGTTVCTNTSTTVLSPGAYKWRVQAMINGVWKNFSDYKTFKVVEPQAGLWGGLGISFYVTPSLNRVQLFRLVFHVDGCGNYSIVQKMLIPIVNNRFSFSGTFHASGVFVTPTRVQGTVGFSSYTIPGCGTLNGNLPWSAIWENAVAPMDSEENSVTITPIQGPRQDLPTFTVDPIKP